MGPPSPGWSQVAVPGTVMGGTRSNFPQIPPLPRPRVTVIYHLACAVLLHPAVLLLRSPYSLPAFQWVILKPDALRCPLQPLPAFGSSQNLPAQPPSKEVTLMNLFQNQQASPCLAPTSPLLPSQAQHPLRWYLPPPPRASVQADVERSYPRSRGGSPSRRQGGRQDFVFPNRKVVLRR